MFTDLVSILKRQLVSKNIIDLWTPSYDPQFFNEYLSGERPQTCDQWFSLMAQVFAILVGGIVLWRLSGLFGKKSKKRRGSMFDESKYQSWKNEKIMEQKKAIIIGAGLVGSLWGSVLIKSGL